MGSQSVIKDILSEYFESFPELAAVRVTQPVPALVESPLEGFIL
jgi:hypothetical protein